MFNPWITTNSGIAFDLVEPTPEMFNIDDIAHALSQQCRYNGHTDRFYSVAEHSTLLAYYFRNRQYSARFCLTALLHEVDEPYYGDMVSPLKLLVPKFTELTENCQRQAAAKFGTIWPMPKELHEADKRIRQDEILHGMANCSELMDKRVEPLGVKPYFWDSETAKNRFLGMYISLMRQ